MTSHTPPPSTQHAETYDPTIEDSYRKTLEHRGQMVTSEILDTAGTDQFVAMRSLYLKNGEGFLLVYSITSAASFNDVDDIYAQILRVKDAEPGEVPIVLVGNKCDMEDERVVDTEDGAAKAKQWGAKFLEVSALSRVGISGPNGAFGTCLDEIDRLTPDKHPKTGKKGNKSKKRCAIL